MIFLLAKKYYAFSIINGLREKSNNLYRAIEILQVLQQKLGISSEINFYIGEAYTKLGDFKKALNFYSQCLVVDNFYRNFALKRVLKLYYRMNKLNKAVEMAKLLEKDKNLDNIDLYYYSMALSGLGLYDEANKKLNQILRDSNNELFEHVFLNLGLNYLYVKDYRRSIKNLKKVIALNSENALAYYNLAVAYDEPMTDLNQAIDYYKKFIELAKGNENFTNLVNKAEQRLKFLIEKQFMECSVSK